MNNGIHTLYKDYQHTSGLVFWNEMQLIKREYIEKYLVSGISEILLKINKSWTLHKFEAPILTPVELINSNYTENDFFRASDLILRPETTSGSYTVAKNLINNGKKPPLCVYQMGKSFRKESSEQSLNTHKRFTEFHQLEFQCLYSTNSKADYYNFVLDNILNILNGLTAKELRLIESDRIPSYSLKTMDIEIKTTEKWLEICSISLRNDFEKDILNVEIAFGMDRMVLTI